MSDPRPTLKAVARRAGVSVSTASLVFSGRGPVSKPTADKVRAAARDLHYLGPDPLASSLRRGRAGVVAVIIEGRLLHAFHDPYAVRVLDGLAAVLDDIPTGMLLMSQDPARPEHAIERLAGTALDATVFLGCGPAANPLVEHLVSRGIPIVALGAPRGPGVVCVDIDNRAASRDLAAHLRGLGHRHLGIVALPTPAGAGVAPLRTLLDSPFPDVAERARGVADVAGPDVPAIVAPGSDIEAGQSAGATLLSAADPPTAIIAQSDLLAAGVLRAAHDLRLRVPRDVSVAGFDGVPLPWWDEPGQQLTTVVQPGDAKGAAAGQAVRDLLDGEHPADVTLPTTLRLGSTTAPPSR